MRQISLLLISMFLLQASICFCAPSISSSDSTSISGESFGSGGSVLIFDDFEDGVLGEYLSTTTWTAYEFGSSGGTGAKFGGEAYSGSLCALNAVDGIDYTTDFKTNYKSFSSTQTSVYVCLKYYVGGEYESGVNKSTRIFTDSDYTSGTDIYAGSYSPAGYLHCDANMTSGYYNSGIGDNTPYNPSYDIPIGNISFNEWHTWEIYIKKGELDGRVDYIIDGVLESTYTGDTTSENDSDAEYAGVWLGLVATNVALDHDVKIDDIYVSNSLARVMVGNNATFANCTHREIQIPTAWSDTSITATWNQGSFENNETAYLFVIDADGTASAGLEGTFVDGTFYSDGEPPISTYGTSISGAGSITGEGTIQ